MFIYVIVFKYILSSFVKIIYILKNSLFSPNEKLHPKMLRSLSSHAFRPQVVFFESKPDPRTHGPVGPLMDKQRQDKDPEWLFHPELSLHALVFVTNFIC